jgi:hypothetical protein
MINRYVFIINSDHLIAQQCTDIWSHEHSLDTVTRLSFVRKVWALSTVLGLCLKAVYQNLNVCHKEGMSVIYLVISEIRCNGNVSVFISH